MTDTEHRYTLTLSLNVLEHLGINLYSNVPAVLSEIVANAWDADATEVRVHWNEEEGTIVIQDNGAGMTRSDINNRFLLTGYNRRDEQPGQTELGRRPMGRKGIGKLSSFSIANVVDVETVKDTERNAFRMDVEGIRKEMQKEEDGEARGTYHPEPIPASGIDFPVGTRITLRELKRQYTKGTSSYLRQRISRRFSILGRRYGFNVLVDDQPVTLLDRGYFDKIEYLWTYGDQSDIVDACVNVEVPYVRDSDKYSTSFEVRGWLATVYKPGQLKVVRGETQNGIAVFMRDKMAQEDMLSEFAEGGNYARYLVGDLHVEALDEYDGPGTPRDDDAATSSRQRIVEGDPRYEELKRFVFAELKYIESEWSELRREKGAAEARLIPSVRQWLDSLEQSVRQQAEDWLGKIRLIVDDDPAARRHLLLHAVVAFEEFRAKENLDALRQLGETDISAALRIAVDVDRIEESYYGRVVRNRLQVIDRFQEYVEDNAKEKIVQEYLFNHLWLLDPSWERTDNTPVMERRVAAMLDELDGIDGTSEEARQDAYREMGRLDIGYRTTAGKHVIIELKRPERVVEIGDVVTNQLSRYYVELRRQLNRLEDYNTDGVEVVLVLGKEPKEWRDAEAKAVAMGMLTSCNARVVFYDDLLHRAQRAYREYRERAKDVDLLEPVLQEIEDLGDIQIDQE